MTTTNKALLLLGGIFLGALTCWALMAAYSILEIERGELAIPFTLVAICGLLLSRHPHLRPLA